MLRPDGFAKWLSVHPSPEIFAFIMSTKSGILPATCSARAFAAWLTDARSSAYRQSSTVMVSPATRLSLFPLSTSTEFMALSE